MVFFIYRNPFFRLLCDRKALAISTIFLVRDNLVGMDELTRAIFWQSHLNTLIDTKIMTFIELIIYKNKKDNFYF